MAKERILVVDDDDYIRRGCTEFLRSVGYEVLSADCGENGVELLKEGAVDLVITDFKMPGLDGLGVLRFVKENYPRTDVILITAHGSIDNAVEAMKLGAYDYLPKTFDIDELDLIVKRCLEKRRLSAEVSELKELVNLYEVSKAINSIMSLDELLELMLRTIADALAADGGSIMLYDPDTNELAVRVALGPRREIMIDKRVALGERIAGYAAQQAQAVSVQGTLKDDPRFSHLQSFDHLESGISVPLIRNKRLLGVVNLSRKEKAAKFNQRDENLLTIFATEAAIAIENTYLFNRLEQEKEELNATFAGMADGALVTDARLNIVRLNHAAEVLLGVSMKDSLGKNLCQAIPDYEPSLPWERIQRHTELTINFEFCRKKSKPLYLGALATAIVNQEGTPIGQIMVLRDITDEKQEERLKMDFLALISHKLKTPLTTINGFSSLLLDKAENIDEHTRRALQIIKKDGDQLHVLVDKLLRFTLLMSGYSTLEPERSDLGVMLNRCQQGLSHLIAARKAEILIAPSVSSLPPLWVDSMKIIEVLENLIENAIKFNNNENGQVRISACASGNTAVIEVADNGPGIPPEEHGKIFQKFYQIDEYFTGQIEGVGLGLSLVKHLVELHGGTIAVESAVGKGSTFRLTLPLLQKK